MTSTQDKALLSYDSYEKERMIKVINAIDNGRLIYIRFFKDGRGISFYFRDANNLADIPHYCLYVFNAKQANIILMGCCIDISSFNI